MITIWTAQDLAELCMQALQLALLDSYCEHCGVVPIVPGDKYCHGCTQAMVDDMAITHDQQIACEKGLY